MFECRMDPHRCPGGALGTCALGRTGIACGRCEDRKNPASDGTCVACGDGGSWPIVVGTVVVLSLIIIVYVVNMKDGKLRLDTVALLATAFVAHMVLVCQTMTVLSKISVDWPQEVSTWLHAVSQITLNLDELMNAGCVVSTGTLGIYVAKICVTPLVVAVLIIIHVGSVAVCRRGVRPGSAVLVGSIGTTVMAFYISIVRSCGCALQVLSPSQRKMVDD